LCAFFAEGLLVALGKDFFKKKTGHFLCRGPQEEALGKDGIFAEGLTVALGKEFFEKNSDQFLCRGPVVEALGKDSIPRNSAVMVTFLCRGPDRPSLPSKNSPRVLCRGLLAFGKAGRVQ